ncbi:hypothetical protein D1O30_12385 [Methylocystis hirsuta]|uniref:Uncharacterized protein n=1 Tax=Methylocystis hirsuta TaxID=369798 RepID=A0A3M9XR11_9HYPH|nr:hypothetical protein D1O30_12385 [Methylocystis hirsuta]
MSTRSIEQVYLNDFRQLHDIVKSAKEPLAAGHPAKRSASEESLQPPPRNVKPLSDHVESE